MTIGDSCGWGYIRHNPNMKSVTQLIQHLVTAAAGAGNYLLNVGPRPDGTIQREYVTRLEQIGDALHVSDLTFGADVALHTDPELVIAKVAAPRIAAELEEEAAAAAAEEEEAAAAAAAEEGVEAEEAAEEAPEEAAEEKEGEGGES